MHFASFATCRFFCVFFRIQQVYAYTGCHGKVHLSLSVLLAFFICLVEILNNKSVIDAIYIIASYTYGPLLGMFAFGLFTRRQTNDRWVPLIAILSPLICYLADWWIEKEPDINSVMNC